MSLLEVEKLNISFDTHRGLLHAVEDVSFSIDEGETLGFVGESGCGKSITNLGVMGLLPQNARVSAEKLSFGGKSLLTLSEKEYRRIRGSQLTMIFQDAMSSLNPSFTIGFQLREVIRTHQGGSRKEVDRKVIELLDRVGIPDPETRLNSFPHQLSGGMCQRIMIAIAIACKPRLLIADEPTTALDVTIQAQILKLLRDLQQETGMAMIFVTHDLAVLSHVADRVLVMYAGRLVEGGPTREVIANPMQPYTNSLISCLPHHTEQSREPRRKKRLPTIPGLVPDLVDKPSGCLLNPRCAFAESQCSEEKPVPQLFDDRLVLCHKPFRKPKEFHT